MTQSEPVSTAKPSKKIQIIRFLPLIFAGVAVLCLGLFPIRDGGDQWWHLKTGKYLLDVGFDFPEEDVFSWTSGGHEWANHEWLADTLMYLGYQAFGLKGLIALKALVLLLAFYMVAGLIYRRSGSLLWAAAGMLLCGWAAQFSMHLRPPVLTSLLLGVYLHLLLNLRQGKRIALTQIASFFLMILWINLHGGAIAGLVVGGFHLFGALFVLVLKKFAIGGPQEDPEAKQLAKRYAINLALIFIASLCNPFTYHIHLLTFKVMGNKELLRFISELQPPDFRYTRGYLALLILLLFSGAVSLRRVRLSASLMADALLALFFFHQSFNHVRHLPLFSIAVGPMIFQMLAGWHGSLRNATTESRKHIAGGITRGVLIATFAGAIILTCFRFYFYVLPLLSGPGYVRAGIPLEASEFIKRTPFTGRMYNPINFSGYLIWALSPETHKTFTDSRFDIFGSEVLLDCMAIEAANTLSPDDYSLPQEEQEKLLKQIQEGKLFPYWRRALNHYDINFFIVGRNSRLHEYLSDHRGEGWIEVYEDPGYTIYIRDSEENRELIDTAIAKYRSMQRGLSTNNAWR